MPAITYATKAWVVLFIPFLLIAGCGQQNQEKDPDSADDVQKDSPEQPEPSSSLPPNSARVIGIIQNLQNSEEKPVKVSFRIKKIEGYGSSTRPLTEDQQLELTTSSSFLKKQGISLHNGDSLNIVISQSMTLGEESESTWRIVDFK